MFMNEFDHVRRFSPDQIISDTKHAVTFKVIKRNDRRITVDQNGTVKTYTLRKRHNIEYFITDILITNGKLPAYALTVYAD